MSEPVNSKVEASEQPLHHLEAESHACSNIVHEPLPPAQWLGFDQTPLTLVESRYYTQVLIETSVAALLFITLLTSFLIIGAEMPLHIIAIIVPALVLIAATITWLRVSHAKSIAYGVCEHELLMQKGIIWFKRISLPYTRLQHISLSQGPIERKFNLRTLKCFSAGSGSAEIELPGLESKAAEKLRQHLLTMASRASQKGIAEAESAAPLQQTPEVEALNLEEITTDTQVDSDNQVENDAKR
ncbi:PH domain-containing protein [Shewanella woodyi]|uniref:PH domain-containing protein n=1 Tax=Shewanella woodyi TaxID=60961 RepID=UPI0007F86780|nr:PH domain-containing protein [Shewanella woodyi]